MRPSWVRSVRVAPRKASSREISARYSVGRRSPSPVASGAHAEEILEHATTAEAREDIVAVDVSPPPPSTRRGFRAVDLVRVSPFVPVAVIFLPRFLVGEDGVGLVNLFELVLCSLVGLVDVRVVLPCQSPVGLADLLIGGVLVDAQQIVIVAHDLFTKL